MTKIKKSEYFLLFVFLLFFLASCAQGQIRQITLTWSADTYIPLGYQGKALPVNGSIIEVVANIGSGTNPQGLTYQWSVNSVTQKENSGKGKQVLNISIGENATRDYSVKVEIRDKNGSFWGFSSYLTIPIYRPEVVVRPEKIPLIDNQYQASSNQEIELIAQPYFFNISSLDQLDYSWKLGGQEASLAGSANPNILNLKIPQLTQPIIQNLAVEVKNKNNLIQKAQSIIKISISP